MAKTVLTINKCCIVFNTLLLSGGVLQKNLESLLWVCVSIVWVRLLSVSFLFCCLERDKAQNNSLQILDKSFSLREDNLTKLKYSNGLLFSYLQTI